MKVLYIGGTGEISYECVRRGVEMGHETSVFNRGRNRHAAALPPEVRQIRGDLSDDAAYRALADERFDVVCQFLAFRTETVARDIDVFSGTCGQYVFISSASAYQKPPADYIVTENTPLANPYWPYSRAKIEMERLLLDAHAAGTLPVTVVRPSHTHRTRFPGGIAGGDDWAWRMLNGRPIVIHGDGTALWTLTHSADFAVPFCKLLGRAETLGECYHITRHLRGFTWNDIYAAMGEALGAEPDIVHVPCDTLVRYNADWAGPLLGDKCWPVIFDNSKVMSVAGEFACRSLEEAMRAAAEDYAAHRRDAYDPDAKRELHALIDRIASEQRALGR